MITVMNTGLYIHGFRTFFYGVRHYKLAGVEMLDNLAECRIIWKYRNGRTSALLLNANCL